MTSLDQSIYGSFSTVTITHPQAAWTRLKWYASRGPRPKIRCCSGTRCTVTSCIDPQVSDRPCYLAYARYTKYRHKELMHVDRKDMTWQVYAVERFDNLLNPRREDVGRNSKGGETKWSTDENLRSERSESDVSLRRVTEVNSWGPSPDLS